jgi:CRP-like cAMP-binding protein
MRGRPLPATQTLVSKLETLFHLSQEELDAIRSLPGELRMIGPDEMVRRAGDRPSDCFVVVSGVVSSSRSIEGDKRQIMSFYVPGDMPDIRTLHLGRIDCDVISLSHSRLAFVRHEDLTRLCNENPRIAAAFWRSTLVVGAVYREWIVNIGHRSAISRLAHLFCEMMTRMEAAGLGREKTCDLPLTQIHLSQATGLSAVHVNRSLQELRRRGLVVFGNGKLGIPDWDALVRLANFRPDYLYLSELVRAAE